MKKQKGEYSRRDFLIQAGAAGVGTFLSGNIASAQSNGKDKLKPGERPDIPVRPFGKSGIEVPILSLGGIVDFKSNQLILDQALKNGVTYWDTAESYLNGGSEEGIGKYFDKFPKARQQIFLVSKTTSRGPEQLTRALEESLERLKTDYLDLYFLHDVNDVGYDLDDNIRKWAEKAKIDGKIKLFGFSTHADMARCLMDASKFDWIDGIMTTYNYRIMHTEEMKAAINACAAAGIGITAMKTMARSAYAAFLDLGEENKTAAELTDRFIRKGFTVEQARLKAVWENPHIASICSQMPSLTILMANLAAAVDKTRLTGSEKRLMDRYARESSARYCAGCRENCESAVKSDAPVAHVMRCLMYARSYGEPDRARKVYRNIPEHVRTAMARIDYSAAERSCPRGLPIGRLMQEAVEELG